MRFFQQIKFQFVNQQALIQPSFFHESGRPVSNNMEKQQHNLLSIEGVGFNNTSASSEGNLTKSISRLLTKQRTVNMLALSSILVVLLHGFGLIWLWRPAEQIASTRPIAIEVTIIPVSALKPKVAPPPPVPAKKKLTPKKTQPKPTLKKMPVVQKLADFAPKQHVIDAPPLDLDYIGQCSATDKNRAVY